MTPAPATRARIVSGRLRLPSSHRLLHPRLGRLARLLGGEVLHASPESPLVSERIGDLAVPIAPERIFHGIAGFTPCRDGLGECSVGIVDVDVEGAMNAAQRLRGFRSPG